MHASLQICLAAAAVLTSLRQMIYRAAARVLPKNVSGALAYWAPSLIVWLFVVLSLSRAVSLVNNYGAPMSIYRALPKVGLSSGSQTMLLITMQKACTQTTP